MTVDVRCVHFELSETSRAYLDAKLERIGYAKDMIVDLIFVITKDKEFKLEVTVNFRWGVQAHMEERDFDVNPGIDKLMDRLEQKIAKEKEKVQETQVAAESLRPREPAPVRHCATVESSLRMRRFRSRLASCRPTRRNSRSSISWTSI